MVFVVSVHLKSFEHVSGTEFLIPKAWRSNNLFMNVLLVSDFYLVFHLLILSVDNGFLTIFFHRLGLVTSNNLFLEWGLEELQCQISLFPCLSRVSRASAQVDDAELVLCNKPNSLCNWCNSRLVERIFFRYLFFFFFFVDILFFIIIIIYLCLISCTLVTKITTKPYCQKFGDGHMYYCTLFTFFGGVQMPD